MNKNELKKSLLEKLAQTEGDLAENTLIKEAERLAPIITGSVDYLELKEAVELLDIFAFRVSDKVVAMIGSLLETIENRTIECPNEVERYLANGTLKPTLVLRALQTLEKIRYHRPDEALALALAYTNHPDETVSKQAVSVLSKMAHYDINIFYGGDTGWGLGHEPQEKILALLNSLKESEKESHVAAVIAVCEELLSGEMEGVDSDYKTFSISRTFVPPTADIIAIRQSTLNLLAELYSLAKDDVTKKQILRTMQGATRATHGVQYPDDYLNMIDRDTVWFLRFLETIMDASPLDFRESLEDDVYRLYRHTKNPEVKTAALAIKAKFDADPEFQIFKTLIGFEGVFHGWDETDSNLDRFSETEKYREEYGRNLVDGMSAAAYQEWETRIKRYATVESNDMATFPIFGKFLEYLGEKQPDLAYGLLNSEDAKLERFFVALLVGLYKADRPKALSLLADWVERGLHIFSVGRFLQLNSNLEMTLLKQFADKAFVNKDALALITLTGITATHFKAHPSLVHELFVPAVELLSEQKDIRWVWDFWYRRERKDILSLLSREEAAIILDNLVTASRIEHQLEESLVGIAALYPDLVLAFFKRRLDTEPNKDAKGERFEAIPYEFHSLNAPFLKHADLVVNTVRDWYEEKDSMFRFRGARLLKDIFTAQDEGLVKALSKFASTGELKDSLFVADVLANYTGEASFDPVLWALIENGPEDDSFRTRVDIALLSTGVVSGEYGMAVAYEKKAERVKTWLAHESPKVRKFAEWFVETTLASAKHERERAESSLAVRKLKYGTHHTKQEDSDSESE